MKSGYKIARRVAYALLGVGLVLVIVATIMGASWREANVSAGWVEAWTDRWDSRRDRGRASSADYNSGSSGDMGGSGFANGSTGSSRDDKNDDTHSSKIFFNESYTDVTTLKFDIDSAEVEVVSGDTFSISAGGEGAEFRSDVKDGVWNVHTEGYTYGNSSRRGNNKYYEITITLPKDFVAEDAEIFMGLGGMDVDRLSTKKANLGVGMGEFDIDNLTSQETMIDCGMGTVDIDGNLTGKTTIGCGMGEVSLELTGKQSDYGYTASVGMGSIGIGSSVSLDGLAGDSSAGSDRPNQLYIDCGMGTVQVDFK